MPRTILCQKCGITLNLPATVTAGKRVKCPKCGDRFIISERDASSASTAPGVADVALASSHQLANPPPSREDLPIPLAGGELRETFDRPLVSGESAKPAVPLAQFAPALSDAEALFQDEPAAKKKLTGAKARSKARKCVHCGCLVPIGMSLCGSCGTDQETGMRVGLEDDLAPSPPPLPAGPPLHISISGFLCGLASVILGILALIHSVRGDPGVNQYGWICLALVSAFGVFGVVQFLRGNSVKMLMIALTLGVLIDITALIALPIYQANFEDMDRVVSKVQKKRDEPELNDVEDVEIKPIAERLDQQKITLGIIIIFIYAVFSIYLMSPPVKRYFARRPAVLGPINLP
jgi:DNA-directed RNA polymerase subunit RPC12/RpoP